MKLKDIRIGMQVVVNELPDTQIYTVDKILEECVFVSYPTRNNGIASGSASDASVLRMPSHEQYQHHLAQLRDWLVNK